MNKAEIFYKDIGNNEKYSIDEFVNKSINRESDSPGDYVIKKEFADAFISPIIAFVVEV